jgi:hypothetical protein
MYSMQKRQLYQTSQKTTRSLVTNDDTTNTPLNTYADSQIRQNPLNLGRAIQNVSSWASSLQAGLASIKPAVKPLAVKADNKVNLSLSEHLNATVYDVDMYGSVPELINHRIQTGIENASFLVTDLTTVVE